jgi:succinate dehydrogenase hydrophobic anchor subunit
MTTRIDPATPAPEAGSGGGFAAQAFSGAALLALLTVHMVAQHFVVSGGLRRYEDVVEWLSNPIVVVVELAFLVFVTWHALLGVRAIVFDFGPSRRAARVINWALIVFGVAIVAYGAWLVMTIVSKA